MPKLDFEKAKADIAQIVEIVKTVPEALQQRCFELLFEKAFSDAKPKPEKEETLPADDRSAEPDTPAVMGKKIPGNIKVILHRGEVTEADIGKLFMLEHDPLLPVYKLPTGNTAKAQMAKVMMVLLENGLLNNNVSAPYSELREALKDEGLHDGNFNKVLKRNAELFRGAISKESIDENGTVELTGAGMKKLAETIKELAQ
ncbi:hypothetical protein [Bradyrhizobium liaoningense]|uniref:hypothetical protein n=1 Tax=Bradyrhizobium liaoningense TaxID=43992 RepID=UPI001BA51904|nr:hypothetical protein [Bradyrhizobium liaoningense]MBR0857153.1 hypothetical protein [Bradyrhizobium liaoningense]